MVAVLRPENAISKVEQAPGCTNDSQVPRKGLPRTDYYLMMTAWAEEGQLPPFRNEVFWGGVILNAIPSQTPFWSPFSKNWPDQGVVNFRPPQVPMEVSSRAKNLGIDRGERAESIPQGPKA